MKRHRLFAYLLPILIFQLLLRCSVVAERSLLISDLNGQYIDFLAELQRILKGEGSLLWSWNAGLGMSMPALLAYYLASPFNLLLAFFSPERLETAVTLIIGLKLACACGNFALYLEKHEGMSAKRRTGFGLLYAFCGWTAAYFFNLMWLDTLLLLPLLCRAIDRVGEDGNSGFLRLTLLFALCFLSQFYMAYMCGLFCVLYLFESLLTRRDGRVRTVLRFGFAVGIAAGLSAFLLLPTYLTLKNNMGLMGQSVGGFSTQFPFFTLFRKAFPGTFDGMKDCLPHIYCGLPGLIGFLYFLFDRRHALRERITAFAISAFLCLSFWIRPLDFFWHAMDVPSWFPYRYAYVLSFYILSHAAPALPDRRDRRIPLICAGLSGCCALLCGVRSKGFLFSAVFLAAYALCFGVLPAWREALLFLCCCAEVFLNTRDVWNTYGSQFADASELSALVPYREEVRDLLPKGDAFYRIEKSGHRTYNDPMQIGYPGISHFSSTASVSQSEYLKRLGFDCYATWCTYRGADEASNALLGIRYALAEDRVAENEAVFPLFYYTTEDYARLNYASDEMDPVERQDRMLRLLNGSEEPFFAELPVGVSDTFGLSQTEDPDVWQVTGPGAYLEGKVLRESCSSGVLFIPNFSLNYDVYLDGNQMYAAKRDYSPFLIPLHDSWNTFRIEAAEQAEIRAEAHAYCFDGSRLKALADRLNAEAPAMTRNGYTEFSLEIVPAESERLLMTGIPFDAGWSFRFADGKALPLRTIHGGMIGVTVPAEVGGTLKVSYFPYGMKEGLLISAAALVLLCGGIGIKTIRNDCRFDRPSKPKYHPESDR